MRGQDHCPPRAEARLETLEPHRFRGQQGDKDENVGKIKLSYTTSY
jgi:hypothetical protein